MYEKMVFKNLCLQEEEHCLLLFNEDFTQEQINFFSISSQDLLTEIYFTC